MLLQLIRKWIKKRLGIQLSVIPEYFYEATKDGSLLALILRHYHVVTEDELQLIEETRDPAIAYENYSKHIKRWLSRINFDLTESDMREITHGGGEAAGSLLYEVYMRLENKRGSVLPVKTNKHNFVIEKVTETDDVFLEVNSLCAPLIQQWDVINWERDHLAALMKKYVESREEYQEYLEQKKIDELSESKNRAKLEDTLLFLKAEKTDYSYDELIAQQKAALEMEPFEPNTDEAKLIMKQIKQRNKQRAERTAFRVELQHLLLTEVWKKIAEIEEDQFDKAVCEKLLKQSIHEKEIAEKLLSIRKQKEIMKQNRKKQDELERKQRDEEFIRKLFKDSLEERLKFHEERMKLIEEHKRLYAEKLRIKVLKRQKICKETLEDCINLAIKIEEYKEMYGVEPDKYTIRNWKTLLNNQQPIFHMIAPSEVKEPLEGISEEIYGHEIKREDILNEQDFEDYIYFRDVWIIEEGLEDFETQMELGMNCLGYAVHRVLLKKYPRPVPDKSELSQEIEISVCVHNMTDLSKLDFLQRLLEMRNVKVIRLEDAVDFCIKAYETELKTEYDDPFPEEEYLKELSPTKAKNENGKKKGKGKKEKGGTKGKGGKKEKSTKKGSKKDKDSKKSKGKKAEIKTDVEERVFEEKQSQTPRLFPWERIVFSNKAKLGRIAKQNLGQEGVLDDKLLVDMFVEYLLSLPELKGWVLINYPTNYEQTALLEQALSGKPVPKEYYDKVLNRDSLASIGIEEEEEEAEEEENIEGEEEKIVCNIQEYTVPKQTKNGEEIPKFDAGYSKFEEKRLTGDNRGISAFSGITVWDDWNIAPKERIEKLLPDLKKLAYSSDEEAEENLEDRKTKKTCSCVCSLQTTPQEMKDQLSNDDAADEDKLTDTMNNREDIRTRSTSVRETVESESGAPIVDQECICYVNNSQEKEETQIKLVHKITQTDILGLEQDTGVADNQPLERFLAEDINEQKRISKIVPNPRPLEKEEYKTVLTSYIKIMEKEDKDDEDYPISIFQELEKKNGLEKFYCDQGCYYILQYDEFTGDTIKCLAKMIIGDYSLPWKTSVEIFGERYQEAMLADGEHKITKKGKKTKEGKDKKKKKKDKKSKSDVKISKDKKSKSSKSSKSKKSDKSKKGKKNKKEKKEKKGGKDMSEEEIIGHEDKEVQVPIVEEVEEEQLPEPRAGEPDWEYINLPISENVELVLADFWVNFEENYMKNFKNLFFNKRVLLNDIVPFLARTRQTMNEFIERPDTKQHYLREFQKSLNEVGLDCRDDPKIKEELLCRIEELRDKLLGICDVKMQESEEERRNFIRENWLFHQFCQIANNSSLAFQLEIDRLVDTLQFISDYYIAIITKSIKEGYNFHKQILPKHECKDEGNEDFNLLFVKIDSLNDENTQFHKYIDESRNTALGFVESMKPLALKPFTNMKELFEPKAQEKKAKLKSKKTDKNKGKKFELDEDVKENVESIFEEWECAINGEFARMNIHLNVIRNEAFNRMNDVIMWIKTIFRMIYDDISVKYENELAGVNKACELLANSVEKETIIHPQLTFENDNLAEIQVKFFPETLVIPEENNEDGTFKIEQIEYMVKILFDLAHSGYILRNTFLLLIQDILYQEDMGEYTDTPKIWRNLPTSALNTLLLKLFDDEKYLYWKDFIVCNLMIAFPTREEMMQVRKQFVEYDPWLTEKVTREQFDRVTFWFEEEKHINSPRLKNIIFKMYQTDEDEFNYTPMLLDFCKDKDQVLGFVKALELSLGKFICYDVEMGNKFVTEILEDRILFQQQKKDHEETVILAKKAVSLLIDRMLDFVEGPEGFTLTEIEERSSIPSINDRSVSKNESYKSELSQGKFIAEHKFSYTKIGFESRDNTQICYFLPLELILIIVSTELSWNSKAEDPEFESFKDKIVDIYEECRNEKFNNVVLAHEFLNCEKLRHLLDTTNKFLAHNPIRLVKKIIYNHLESVADPEEFQAVGSMFSEWTEFSQIKDNL